jgi:hypothetical protein
VRAMPSGSWRNSKWPKGLAAAVALRKAGHDIIVLERNETLVKVRRQSQTKQLIRIRPLRREAAQFGEFCRSRSNAVRHDLC